MKKIILFLSLLALNACGPNAAEIEAKIKAEVKRQQDSIANVEKTKTDVINSVQNQQTQENNIRNTETDWNYSGAIDKYPIKAQINYGEGTNSEGTGALHIPITGYYFYESQNLKIPIEGSSNGSGIIYFVAHTSDGDETFDGQFTDGILEDFSGTWSKGKKQLNFSLNLTKSSDNTGNSASSSSIGPGKDRHIGVWIANSLITGNPNASIFILENKTWKSSVESLEGNVSYASGYWYGDEKDFVLVNELNTSVDMDGRVSEDGSTLFVRFQGFEGIMKFERLSNDNKK